MIINNYFKKLLKLKTEETTSGVKGNLKGIYNIETFDKTYESADEETKDLFDKEINKTLYKIIVSTINRPKNSSYYNNVDFIFNEVYGTAADSLPKDLKYFNLNSAYIKAKERKAVFNKMNWEEVSNISEADFIVYAENKSNDLLATPRKDVPYVSETEFRIFSEELILDKKGELDLEVVTSYIEALETFNNYKLGVDEMVQDLGFIAATLGNFPRKSIPESLQYRIWRISEYVYYHRRQHTNAEGELQRLRGLVPYQFSHRLLRNSLFNNNLDVGLNGSTISKSIQIDDCFYGITLNETDLGKEVREKDLEKINNFVSVSYRPSFSTNEGFVYINELALKLNDHHFLIFGLKTSIKFSILYSKEENKIREIGVTVLDRLLSIEESDTKREHKTYEKIMSLANDLLIKENMIDFLIPYFGKQKNIPSGYNQKYNPIVETQDKIIDLLIENPNYLTKQCANSYTPIQSVLNQLEGIKRHNKLIRNKYSF